MIDYEILKVIWWLFIGVLLVGFAIMDGQDMGVGTLLPFLSKEDGERRVMINAVAPHWDGNQVWLITGGGAMFAAWPLMYATAFSGFYWAMLVVLAALILRPVGFDYRSKVSSSKWRTNWDWLLFIGSAVPPIIFGVAFGNLLQGVPFEIDSTMRPIYTGSFFGLLNPFGLLCGVLSLLMIVFHGANYLVLRTEGALQARAQKAAVLQHRADALTHRRIIRAAAEHLNFAAVRPHKVENGLDERRLSGAVFADQTHHAAARQSQIDAVQRKSFVFSGQSSDFKCVLH